MIIKMTATNPAEIEMTLTATMTLKQWTTIKDGLRGVGYGPVGGLRDAIIDAIWQAQKEFVAPADTVSEPPA